LPLLGDRDGELLGSNVKRSVAVTRNPSGLLISYGIDD